jgi:hypothetical protein
VSAIETLKRDLPEPESAGLPGIEPDVFHMIDYPSEWSSPEELKQFSERVQKLPDGPQKQDLLQYLKRIPSIRKRTEDILRERGIILTE